MASSMPDMTATSQLDDAAKADISRWAEVEIGKAKVRSAIHSFTTLCFKKCVKNADSNRVTSQESSCLQNCVGRFLDTNIKVVDLISSQAN